MPGRDRHPSQRARRPSGRGPHGHVQHESRIVSAGRGGRRREGERAAAGRPWGAGPSGRRPPRRWVTGRGRGAEGRRRNAAAATGGARRRSDGAAVRSRPGLRRAAGERRFVKADPGRRLGRRRSALRLAASHVCVTWFLQNTSSLCGFCNAGAR